MYKKSFQTEGLLGSKLKTLFRIKKKKEERIMLGVDINQNAAKITYGSRSQFPESPYQGRYNYSRK